MTKMKNPYQVPLYYEIAFDFFSVKKQINFFEKLFKKYSKIKVKKVLDICCGPSKQLRELARRGYEGIGLDLSEQMLNYLKKIAREEGLKIRTKKRDMYKFKLGESVDFAFIMMGSLAADSNKDFLNHLDSVANCLRKGGLYFIQNFAFSGENKYEEWEMKKGKISVKTSYKRKLINPITQTVEEELIHQVNDNGKKMKFVETNDYKIIYPEEFKLLIEKKGKFEFLGWYAGGVDNWDLKKPLEKAENTELNMVLLRRK